MSNTSNKLKYETSPYLLQHADNPVHWYAWGEEALNLAKQLNKPILLSIGYSACHWCHVMAHESFEDQSTADLMNQLFINIKVDREERPDLDKVYQLAHQYITQRSGGWPLTMFLTADTHIPFYAGTYFPKGQKYGRPAFESVLQQLSDAYDQRQDDITTQTTSLQKALSSSYQHSDQNSVIDDTVFNVCIKQLHEQFDQVQGGFGSAPKFPHVSSLERLLRHDSAHKHPQSKQNAIFTLAKMAQGGMNDQLAGGFCRYSVDDLWMIPHFEKMLYDNAVLLALYAEAYALDHSPLFLKTCLETAHWTIQEMQAEHGGYCSSLDADSEGEEGKFYVWDVEQVKTQLNEQEFSLIELHFGLNQPANFAGHWHFHVYQTLAELETKFDFDVKQTLQSARQKLIAQRQTRIAPDRDDKVLTSWNALMIRAMAITARYCNKTDYALSATRAIDFIQQTLFKNGRLLATYKDNKAHLMAYLDDHAFLLDALLELLQVRWREQDINFAIQIAELLLTQFEDTQQGGFWFVANDHETLLQRPKTYHDEAIPSGNAVAAFALQRLGYLLGITRYVDSAQRAIKNAATATAQMPYAHCAMLKAAEEQGELSQTLIIRCDQQHKEQAKQWLALANQHYAPFRQSYLIEENNSLPHALTMKKIEHGLTAYCCQGMSCGLPIYNVDDLTSVLNK